jgi:hypothetical protein
MYKNEKQSSKAPQKGFKALASQHCRAFALLVAHL